MPLEELVEYIDWTPFFAAWELPGHYPEILQHDADGRGGALAVGRRAEPAQARRRREACCAPTRSVGFWPANATDDDDIVLYTDESADDRARTPAHPAPADGQAGESAELPPCRTTPRRSDRASRDYVGAFAVTAGGGLDEASARFEAKPATTTRRSCSTSLADRLAEAVAEWLHAKVRRELWGYAPDEALDNDGAHRRVVPGHPTRARLPGAARITPRSARSSDCSTRSARPASA